MTGQHSQEPMVFVVDDDESLRGALKSLFQSVGLQVEAFATTLEFLEHPRPEVPSCLVLDVRLPGTSGLDFQAELTDADVSIPIIFMTGHGDIPMSVRAMKAGAVEFLTKPFRDQEMLDAVQAALKQDTEWRQGQSANSKVLTDFETLTPREKEVMTLVTAGLMNKQVAGELGISEITAKMHRGNVTKKMGARSLADLVRMAEVLGLHRPKP